MIRNFFVYLCLIIVCCTTDNKTAFKVLTENDTLANYSLCDSLHNHRFDSIPFDSHEFNKGDNFKILYSLNFDKGEWTAILETKGYYDRCRLDTIGIKANRLYILKDLAILRSMQNEWIVTYESVDCCTPDMNLEFYSGTKRALTIGILFNKDGFQSGYGVTYPVDSTKHELITKYLKYFKLCKNLKEKEY